MLAGAAAGLALGVYLSRFVVSLLYDVRPLAVSSVGWPVAALVGVAILAAALPLRRALQLSPAEALRDTL